MNPIKRKIFGSTCNNSKINHNNAIIALKVVDKLGSISLYKLDLKDNLITNSISKGKVKLSF